ncbi:MAG: hypothetical protein OEY11_15405 [Gammaproteobacteria bacterium]|nr:hypothetical protein [Gammaproteobacteria bacterium]
MQKNIFTGKGAWTSALFICLGFIFSIEAYANNEADQACQELFRSVNKFVDKQAVTDVQSYRFDMALGLRTNRFLATIKTRLKNNAQKRQWLRHQAKLDEIAFSFEWRNLNLSGQQALLEKLALGSADQLTFRLDNCRVQQLDVLMGDSKALQRVVEVNDVPDDYQGWKRWLGLYPISSLFVKRGVRKLHAEYDQDFDHPVNERTATGSYTRYGPMERSESLPEWRGDALGIPVLESYEEADLLSRYAPVWEIETVSGYDLPGAVYFDKQGKPAINVRQPVSYQFISYTLLNDRVLPQLNYVIWFSERPKSKALDLFSGRLDSLIWRVTLDEHFKPLLADSIHSCGCYHKLFLTPAVNFAAELAGRDAEPLYVAKTRLQRNKNWAVRIESATHFVRGVYAVTGEVEKTYYLQPYSVLRSLPDSINQKSLFNNKGIVKYTQRFERWFLWPTGVRAPGSMRQAGHHATAFSGRRHFDDPYWFNRFFSYE